MCHCKHLHCAIDFPVNHRKWESLQRDLTDVRLAHDPKTLRSATGALNGTICRLMVSPTEAYATLFVVGDLLLVLQRRIWMEPVVHFSRD